MVEKAILVAHRYGYFVNSSIMFRINHPDKGIGNNRDFRLALIEELVVPLLLTNSSDGTLAVVEGFI